MASQHDEAEGESSEKNDEDHHRPVLTPNTPNDEDRKGADDCAEEERNKYADGIAAELLATGEVIGYTGILTSRTRTPLVQPFHKC
jgi:hypothetical protein